MHTEFLNLAIKLAEDNVKSKNGGPYGAIVVKQGEIISASGNKVTANLDPTAHAEVMAIRQACQLLNSFQLTDCILYSSCEPCPMCLGAIYWARLDEVYFACNRKDAANAGFDDSFIYDQLAVPPEQRKIAMHHLKTNGANRPFLAWNKDKDKTHY